MAEVKDVGLPLANCSPDVHHAYFCRYVSDCPTSRPFVVFDRRYAA